MAAGALWAYVGNEHRETRPNPLRPIADPQDFARRICKVRADEFRQPSSDFLHGVCRVSHWHTKKCLDMRCREGPRTELVWWILQAQLRVTFYLVEQRLDALRAGEADQRLGNQVRRNSPRLQFDRQPL